MYFVNLYFFMDKGKKSLFFSFFGAMYFLWGGRGACLVNRKGKKKMETMEEKKEIAQNIKCLHCYLKKEIIKLQAENRALRYTIKEHKAKNEMYFLHIHRLQNTLLAFGVNSKGFL